MTATTPYTYQSLSPHTDDEIRLLHLSPGTGNDDVLQFRLHPVRLSESPSYEAISYCWGNPADTRSVLCDGKAMAINASLHVALCRLRLPNATRVLWADAVCINQEDVDEKNRQVHMMGRIYTQPTRVLIWLGEGGPELQGLRECISTALELLPTEAFEWGELYERARRVYVDALKLQRKGKPNLLDHDWRPIAHVFRQPWFDRRWIIQEVASSAEHVPRLAICGDVEFVWDDLGKVAYRICSYFLLPLLSGISGASPMSQYRVSFYADNLRPLKMLHTTSMVFLMRYYRDRGGTLVDGIIATAYFNCTDPRDHLYSLLSLTRIPSGMKPDYNLSTEEVLLRFATMSLVTEQNLKLLSIAPHAGHPLLGVPTAKRLDLPSWVPGLTYRDNGLMEPIVTFSVRPPVFHAGGKDEKPAAAVSADGRVLHLRGRIVDKVAALATSLLSVPLPDDAAVRPRTGLAARTNKRVVNWISECREIAADGQWDDKASDPSFRRAFAETLLCGMTGMRDPVTEDVLDALQVYSDYVLDYFTDGYQLSEEVNTTLLTYGALTEQALLGITSARRVCRTEGGRLGQVRNEAQKGDLFCVILGAEVPYLLRPSPGKAGVYTIIGDSFLLGVMQGEALEDGRYETVDITVE